MRTKSKQPCLHPKMGPRDQLSENARRVKSEGSNFSLWLKCSTKYDQFSCLLWAPLFLKLFLMLLVGITIKSMACDPQMQRLLVSYTEENGRASVLLYSTSRRPVLLVRFIGDISDESLEHIDSICFHQGLSQGALIAIKSGNTVRILPLLYDE